MSTALSQPTPSSWKEEVNLRLAAHRNRRGSEANPSPAPTQMHSAASSRAAQAAARVAARYAQARSYSEMQAEEARVAVRAAEIATQVALEAQANAEAVLANLDAAVQSEPVLRPELVQSRPEQLEMLQAEVPPQVQSLPESTWDSFPMEASQVTATEAPVVAQQEYVPGVRWEPALPELHQQIQATELHPGYTEQRSSIAISPDDWWAPAEPAPASATALEAIEPAQPISANLIEFPQEIVATRKVRPRRAEGEHANAHEGQLSIFEVDPQALSTEAEPLQPEPVVAAEWRGMELENALATEEVTAETERVVQTAAPEMATMNLRMLAGVTDATLITAAFLTVALVMSSHIVALPSLRVAELVAVAGWGVTALLYELICLTVAGCTPGMKYAGISFCTLDEQIPTRAALLSRLAALTFSMAPMGLGILWALFDEENLSWHDRISKTYPRVG